ncbi:MAG: DUF456 domain-containing protein [Acidimicrobiales bacterium]
MSVEIWSVLAAVVMVVGLCGVVIPVVPGLILIWITAAVYGVAVGFDTVGIAVMVLLSGLLVVSVIKGLVIPGRTAARSGASGLAQLAGVAGAVAGFFLIPVIGIVVGALVGVLATEYLVKGDWGEAWTATKGLAKGFGISALIDLGLGLMMITIWSVWAVTVVV